MLAHQEAWLEHILPVGTKYLSHLKLSAIFIESMIELTPIAVGEAVPRIGGSVSYQDGDGIQFPPPERLPERELAKFVDGQTPMLAWLIGYHICEFFEKNRIDRVDDFVARTTDEFEIDVVSALFSGRVSAQAMHLILKALFLRD
ncbi:hypothetical protein [Sphingomonas sp. Root710]|uniref:hypothetical protein n=1 Tax=Sphingomonas sp. Root710 TaxID=1736594 RepID=UPI00138F055E|nr:hypothetical protein [Sphingomonas sp. Root710]